MDECNTLLQGEEGGAGLDRRGGGIAGEKRRGGQKNGDGEEGPTPQLGRQGQGPHGVPMDLESRDSNGDVGSNTIMIIDSISTTNPINFECRISYNLPFIV